MPEGQEFFVSGNFFDSSPAAAHARQLKGLELYGEGLSRRDSVKVAQYEVLGNETKRLVRSGQGTIGTLGFWRSSPKRRNEDD
jgi:hypothetical protein